jgi:hypothetical protein
MALVTTIEMRFALVWGISKVYNLKFLCNYEILNKLFHQKKLIYDFIAISNHLVPPPKSLSFNDFVVNTL